MGTVTFLFVGQSARLGEPLGFVASHPRPIDSDVVDSLRACLLASGGRELDLTVDGMGCAIPSAAAGVACAAAMQRAVGGDASGDVARGVGLRVGVHTGEPLAIPGGRYFGAAVWLAARLCARAVPGQILVSDVVCELVAPNRENRLREVGALELKGLSDAVVAYEVEWDPQVTPNRAVDSPAVRTVTFLTVDQVGSTAQIDSLGDSAALAVHDALLDMLRESIEDHDGREVEYTGDGVTASFDTAVEATACAVAMQQAAFRHRLRFPSDRTLLLRVGIHTGEAVPGDRVSGGLLAGRASRLCGCAGDGQILTSGVVRSIVEPRRLHEFRLVDASGVSAAEEAEFELRWDPAPWEFALPEELGAVAADVFVGRFAEMDWLDGLWSSAASRERRTAVVGGDVGIGKTALAARFASVAHDRDGAVVLYAACRDQPVHAYQPFTEALSGYVVTASRADLRRQVGAHLPVLSQVVPQLRERIPDVAPVPLPGAEAEVSAVAKGVETFLAAISVTAPVLLIIDGLELATPHTLAVLRHLVDGRTSAALFVIGLVRETRAETSPVLAPLGAESNLRGRLEHRVVSGLDDREVAELVTAITGTAPSPELVGSVATETAGMPFLVVELARNQMQQTVALGVQRVIAREEASRLDLREMRAEIATGVLEIQRLRLPPTAPRATGLATGLVEADGTPPAAGPCPYRGLSYFDDTDAEWFFGREQLVAELVAHLAGSRLVGVLGASGSGKSSLVRAGLLPMLGAGALPGSDAWVSVVMTPGSEPFLALFRALAGTGRLGPDDARVRVERDGLTALAAELVGSSSSRRLLIVVDQCEELFTATPDDERGRFIAALLDATATPESPVIVIAALRADYYGACARYPALADRLEDNHVLVGAMTDDEIRLAIEAPARHAWLTLEAGLIDAITADVTGEPGGLPLLSTALLETWERRRGRSLTLKAYADTGGVRRAVARLADSVYDNLDADQQPIARRMFLRLARPGEHDATADVRRRARLDELTAGDPAATTVLTTLVERRLVTTDEYTAEVAHEALLREWPRLTAWLDEDRDGRRVHQQLADTAHDWNSTGHDPEQLYRGTRLTAATDWATTHSGDVNSLEHEFLRAARTQETAELDHARRSTRRLRYLTIGIAAFLVVALIAGALALIQRNAADDRASEATARRLGAQALAESGDAFDTRLLLAVESYRRDRSIESEGALVTTLDGARHLVGYERAIGRGVIAGDVTTDRSTFVTLTTAGVVQLWDTKTWKRRGPPLATDLSEPTSVEFSPDGRLVVTTSREGAQIWNVDSRQRMGAALAPVGLDPVRRAIFSPDGKQLVTYRTSQLRVQLWNVATGALASERGENIVNAAISGIAFTGDGTHVIAAADTAVARYDVLTGERIFRTFGDFTGDVTVSPDGTLVALGLHNGVFFLDPQTFDDARPPLVIADATVEDLRFSPDGKLLAVAADDGSVTVFAMTNDALIARINASAGATHSVTFLGPTTLATFDQGGLAVWDLGEPAAIATVVKRPAPSHFVGHFFAILPRGRIASVGPAGLVIQGRDNATEAIPTGERYAADVASNRRGTLLAFAGQIWDDTKQPAELLSTSVVFLNVPGYQTVGSIPLGTVPAVSQMVFSPDGTRVAVGLVNVVNIYDVPSGKLRRSIHPPYGTGNIAALVWENDRLLASGWTAGLIAELDTTSGRVTRKVTLPGRPAVTAVVPAEHGRQFYVTSDDGEIALVDRDQWALQRSGFAQSHTGLAGAALKGARIVAVGGDGSLRIWDLHSGRGIGTPVRGSNASGEQIGTISENAHSVLTGDGAGKILTWDLDPEAWAARACALVGRDLTHAEWARYLPGEDYRATCAPYNSHAA